MRTHRQSLRPTWSRATLLPAVAALALAACTLAGCQSDDSATPLPPSDASADHTDDGAAGSDGGSTPDAQSTADASGGDAADGASTGD
jgi:hypothetical protein